MGFGFSGEMIFLFFLALILFGPRRLPEIGRQIGRIMNEFRRASNEFRAQIESEINVLDVKNMPQILPPLKEPLGSLASRIFNPPAAGRESVAQPLPAAAPESGAAEKDRSGASAAAVVATAASEPTAPAVSPVAAPAIPSKVAPDA